MPLITRDITVGVAPAFTPLDLHVERHTIRAVTLYYYAEAVLGDSIDVTCFLGRQPFSLAEMNLIIYQGNMVLHDAESWDGRVEGREGWCLACYAASTLGNVTLYLNLTTE